MFGLYNYIALNQSSIYIYKYKLFRLYNYIALNQSSFYIYKYKIVRIISSLLYILLWHKIWHKIFFKMWNVKSKYDIYVYLHCNALSHDFTIYCLHNISCLFFTIIYIYILFVFQYLVCVGKERSGNGYGWNNAL